MRSERKDERWVFPSSCSLLLAIHPFPAPFAMDTFSELEFLYGLTFFVYEIQIGLNAIIEPFKKWSK